jgi:hypothetical protein
MPRSSETPNGLRFGVFEVDLRERELRKSGLRVRLQDQPFQVLIMLLERPGEMVSRGVGMTAVSPPVTDTWAMALPPRCVSAGVVAVLLAAGSAVIWRVSPSPISEPHVLRTLHPSRD